MTERPEWLKRENRDWEKIYSDYDLTEIPWHSEKPDQELIDLVESKEIAPHLVLDVGCGAGTDAMYFASLGHEVTAIDISHEAIRIAQAAAGEMDCRMLTSQQTCHQCGRSYWISEHESEGTPRLGRRHFCPSCLRIVDQEASMTRAGLNYWCG